MSEAMESPSVEGLNAWRMEARPGEAKGVMQELLEAAKKTGAEVLIVDGKLVFGWEHLASAIFHARKAIAEGRNSSESLAMESLLYASGERQLSSAIKKMSVSDATSSIVVVHLEGGALYLGKEWEPLPKTFAPERDDLIQYGISGSELSTVDSGRHADLVLERVAAVDVIKK
ncbi:MAG TPA: KEOPS complex subunit Cgi121 [Thermoplasmata archaeon]|nr:KEOPS complex subunit Cgi121 [Thermoplasmata archaeon]